MSIGLFVYNDENDKDFFEVATNLGWAQFIEFVQKFDVEGHEALFQLAEHGETDSPHDAARQLEALLSDADESVSDISANVLGVLYDANKDSSVIVSNGIIDGGGDDEFQAEFHDEADETQD